MYVVLCLSWNLVGGTMGYPSFGTAAFFGLGAYVCAIAQNAGCPAALAWGVAGIAGALLASLLGLILLGLRGHYFAIGTIAIVVVAHELAVNCESLTGGAVGLNLPILAGTPRQAGLLFYASHVDSCGFQPLPLHARRAFALRLRPALHQAERSGRQNGRRQRLRL